MRLLALLLLCCLLAGGRMQAQTAPADDDTLRVLSWNMYMLPGWVIPSGKIPRAKAIADYVERGRWDVLILQEAFKAGARRRIWKRVKDTYPHAFGPANKKCGIRVNSGVWLLSRTPMKWLGEIEYKDKEGFDNSLARKGAMLVQINWRGLPVQLLGTHLNAGGEWKTRLGQMKQMANELLIPHYQQNIPQLVAGDMNTNMANADEYGTMLNTLQATDGPYSGEFQNTVDATRNDLKEYDENNRKVIDYILWRANGVKQLVLDRSILEPEAPWSKKHRDLSDHRAVEVRIYMPRK